MSPEWRKQSGVVSRHPNEKRPQHSCEEVAGAVIPMRQAGKLTRMLTGAGINAPSVPPFPNTLERRPAGSLLIVFC
jgi:hypothetical protein